MSAWPPLPTKVNSSIFNYIYFIYGSNGVGKTTCVNEFDNKGVLFLDYENGTKELERGFKIDKPNWQECEEIQRQVKQSSAIKAIAIDTVGNWLDLCIFPKAKELKLFDVLDKGSMSFGAFKTHGQTLLSESIQDWVKTGKAIFFIANEEIISSKIEGTDDTVSTYEPLCRAPWAPGVIKPHADFIMRCYQKGSSRYVRTRSDGSCSAKSRFDSLPSLIQLKHKSDLKKQIEKAVNPESLINEPKPVVSTVNRAS